MGDHHQFESLEDDDTFAALLKIDTEIDEGAEKLSALLCDSSAFYEACEAAVALAAVPVTIPTDLQLANAKELQKALNYICNRCQIEEVDDEEAEELFDEPM